MLFFRGLKMVCLFFFCFKDVVTPLSLDSFPSDPSLKLVLQKFLELSKSPTLHRRQAFLFVCLFIFSVRDLKTCFFFLKSVTCFRFEVFTLFPIHGDFRGKDVNYWISIILLSNSSLMTTIESTPSFSSRKWTAPGTFPQRSLFHG